MIRINLLPFRAARKKENIRRQVSVFFLFFIFMLIAAFYYNHSLAKKVDGLNHRITEAKKESQKYEKINKEIAKIKKDLETLEQKTAVINDLEGHRIESVRLLDIMTHMVISQRMWFKSMNSDPGSLKINGVALDNKTVADFMTRLEGSGVFSDVRLVKLQQTQINTVPLKAFDIVCTKPVPKKEPPKDKKGKKGGKPKVVLKKKK